jgi:hypothetical protein
MSEKPNIIGMQDLLDEVERDLDEWRRKNPGDYQIKNTILWWSLQREKILVRHKDARVARRFGSGKRAWMFLAGCLATFILGALMALLVR